MKRTLNEFTNDLKKTTIFEIESYLLRDWKKLITTLEGFEGGDFGKLTLQEIEDEHPYILLEIKNRSIRVFLLYKKLISKL